MARKLLDKAAQRRDLGQSMLEEAKRHAAEASQEAQTGLDRAKKDFDAKGGAAEKQISEIVDHTKAKVEGAMKALEIWSSTRRTAPRPREARSAGVRESGRRRGRRGQACQDAFDEATPGSQNFDNRPAARGQRGQPLVDQAKKSLDTSNELLTYAKQRWRSEEGLAQGRAVTSRRSSSSSPRSGGGEEAAREHRQETKKKIVERSIGCKKIEGD